MGVFACALKMFLFCIASDRFYITQPDCRVDELAQNIWPKNKKFGFRRNSLEGHNRRLKQSCLISTCQMVHFDRVRVYHTLMNSSYKETGLLGHFVCLKIASWDIMSYIWFV